MRALNSVLSAGLALAGMLTSISGVAAGEYKPVLIGLVLLAGAVVFALLHIGARAISARTTSEFGSPAAHEIET
jgi:hypothetical protein